MPIAHPYITATVYLNSNPLTKYKDHEIIKSKYNKVYCSYDKKKYDHIFYLSYDNKNYWWSKIINNIKKGCMKIHISGYYLGYSSKDDKNTSLLHAIQLTEFDFESKFDKFADDNDDNDSFFENSSKNKSKSLLSKNRKHHISSSSSSSETESNNESISSIEKNKKSKKSKKSKSKSSTTFTKTLPYQSSQPSTSSSSLYNYDFNSNIQQNDYSDDSTIKKVDQKNKRSVKFKLNTKQDEEKNNDSIESVSNNKEKGKNSDKIKVTSNIKSALRRSPRKKGIMDIAVDKIIEVSDNNSNNDKMQVDEVTDIEDDSN